MNKLALLSCAATALVPVAALAQPAADPPREWEGIRATPTVAPTDPAATMQSTVSVPAAEAREMDERHREYHRLERGAVVPEIMWGPDYTLGDWSGYGLYQPMHGHRWIRYYDDALLIDSEGRVWDGRYGMDWSRSGPGWNRDGGYAHHGGGYGHQGGYAHHGGKSYSYSYPAYGHGGYGYGAGYGGAWVTETTVTYSGGDCCCEEAVEVVVPERPVYRAPPPPPPPTPPPPPPPSPGERG
ncbi:MAG TPA: RcnB family protein [Allosphingosinicella sp.]